MPQNRKTYKLEELVTLLGDGIHGTPKLCVTLKTRTDKVKQINKETKE
ncbi:MAG: hypothetical protein IBX66_00810 [Lutibacter sp.]|nr:hypothetical protein [Lutibacter sp.]